ALGHSDEHEAGRDLIPGSGAGCLVGEARRDDDDLVVRLVDLPPAEDVGPPLRLSGNVMAVDDDRVPAQSHERPYPWGCGRSRCGWRPNPRRRPPTNPHPHFFTATSAPIRYRFVADMAVGKLGECHTP